MFAATVVSFFALSALAPRAAAMPSSGHIRNVHRAVPAQFHERREYAQDADLLEKYEDYALRYQEWDCPNQHNTTFWEQCCHPLLKDESLDDLPDTCCDPPSPTTSTRIHTSTVAHTHIKQKPTTHATHSTTSDKHRDEEPTTTPTTTERPTTTHRDTAPKTTSTSDGGDGGSGGSWFKGGQGTFFYQGGNAGACGKKHSDDDLIAAVDYRRYGPLDKASPLCGKKARVVNTDNGNSVVVTFADACPSCGGPNYLDLSLGAFKALESDTGVGMIPIQYQILE